MCQGRRPLAMGIEVHGAEIADVEPEQAVEAGVDVHDRHRAPVNQEPLGRPAHCRPVAMLVKHMCAKYTAQDKPMMSTRTPRCSPSSGLGSSCKSG